METIVAVYDNAMKRVLNPTGLLRDRASYYYELGKFEEALQDYERLHEVFPDTELFTNRIEEIKLRLGR